jgi:hypothetical protein
MLKIKRIATWILYIVFISALIVTCSYSMSKVVERNQIIKIKK